MNDLEARFQIQRLAVGLQRYEFRFASEAQLHDGIAIALREIGVEFEHEKTVSADRFDFWCPPGLVIEAKIGGSASQAIRQLDRYCARPDVKAALLVTTTAWGLTFLPKPTLHGKPVRVIHLRRQSF